MRRWRVSISEKDVHGSPQQGSFDSGDTELPSFCFIEAERGSRPINADYKYFMIDTSAWEQYWEDDSTSYIPPDLHSLPDDRADEVRRIQMRIECLYKDIVASGQLRAPSLSEPVHGANVNLEDGRHRIYVIRSLGISAFPAAVPCSIVDELGNVGLLSK